MAINVSSDSSLKSLIKDLPQSGGNPKKSTKNAISAQKESV
jgi:hypothetical protein